MKREFILGTLAASVVIASAAPFDGTFTYLAQSYSFDDGEKTVENMHGDVAVTNNTFSEILRIETMYREVTEQPVYDNGETLFLNNCTQGIRNLTIANTGTFAIQANGVFTTDIGGIDVPFYFDSATNISIAFMPVDAQTNAYDDITLGFMVRQSTDMAPTALNGTYLRYSIGSSAYSNTTHASDHLANETSVMLFDNGILTDQISEWAVTRTISEVITTQGVDRTAVTVGTLEPPYEDAYTNTMPYTLTTNGTIEIAPTMTTQVAPDGQLAISLFAAEYPDPNTYLSFIIKPPVSMPTNAIDALFFVGQVEEYMDDHPEQIERANYNDFGISRSYVELRADSTFSIRTDTWELSETLDNEFSYLDDNLIAQNKFETEADEKITLFYSGTYQVAPDGKVTLTTTAGDLLGEAQLSENGQYFILIGHFAEDNKIFRMLGLGIRRTPPPQPTEEFHLTGEMEMTTTGMVMQATVPANWTFEGLYTDDLMANEWKSGGLYTSPSNSLEIIDANAQDYTPRFYTGTFAPW